MTSYIMEKITNKTDQELARDRTWLLTEPTSLKKMKPARFTTESRIVHRLGTESVSDQILSVMELVKNSIDAKASEIYITLKNMKTGNSEIIIEDNGTGMDLNRLEQGWLRLATSIKLRDRLKSKKQQILGEKGIGRFAVENLSKKTIITSYPEKSRIGYRVIFNWEDFQTTKDLDEINSARSSFQKPDRKQHGLKIELSNLRYKWKESDVHRLWRAIRTMTPPDVKDKTFRVIIVTDEFEELSGNVENNFLNKSAFKFEAVLEKTGNVRYTLWKFGQLKPVRIMPYKYDGDLKCGPVTFVIHFFYKAKKKMEMVGLKNPDMNEIKNTLDNFGNVKIYRDKIRLSSFGNPDDDWLGLDNRSRNQPSIVPSTHQIIGRVDITSKYNPEINDTSARENIIENDSFLDLVRFIDDSIAIFAQMRSEVEKKGKSAPKKPSKYVEHARKKMKRYGERKPLLDFGNDYPFKAFMVRLEDEINECYAIGQPNAVLILSRKLVENLVYDILGDKYPKNIDLWYDTARFSAHGFGILLENLENNVKDFPPDQRELIHKLLSLIKPFKRNANSKTHQVMEYLDSIDDLDNMKIDQIIQLGIELYKKVKATS